MVRYFDIRHLHVRYFEDGAGGPDRTAGAFCAAENTSQITLDTSETLFAYLLPSTRAGMTRI